MDVRGRETLTRLLCGMLDKITPVVITYNEAANISRMLERLQWAQEVVIIDSFSEDETLLMASKFPNVRTLQRNFDCFANQFNFALREAGIRTEWTLTLNADYVLSDQFAEEIKNLDPPIDVAGYRSGFIYCVFGRPLRTSVYSPRVALFRRQKAYFRQDGHTERLVINGRVLPLDSRIMHDDRKPLDRWLDSQGRYSRLEAEKLTESRGKKLRFLDRLRKTGFMTPFAMLFHCLFVKGLILDGWYGMFYTFQRVYAELLLCLRLLETKLKETGS